MLIIESKVSRDDYGGGDGLRIMANQVMTLQMARERYARSLSLALTPGHDIERLATILTTHRLPRYGAHPAATVVQQRQSISKLKIAPKWMVTPSTALFEELETLLGSRAVRRELVNTKGRLKPYVQTAFFNFITKANFPFMIFLE